MNTPPASNPSSSRQQPLLIAAAIAVIVFCIVGTAAIMGWLPSSAGGKPSKNELSEFDRAALASRLAQDDKALPAARSTQSDASLAAQRFAEVDRVADPVAPLPRKTVTHPVQHASRADRVVETAPETGSDTASRSNWCGNCGNIESVREITQRAQGSGLGAAGGAVLGGLLGNQIGGGHGRQLATVAGAVGGAVVGNQVEGNMKGTRSYEIRVRLDDGGERVFSQQSAAGWRTGDRVKVVNGALRPVH